MFSVAVLFLHLLCCLALDERSSSWFRSSCRPQPSDCLCRMRESTLCTIGSAKRVLQQPMPCDALPHSLTYLNISCVRNQECDSLDIGRILFFFPSLLSLGLHGCALDMTKYEIMRNTSSVLMSTALSRSPEDMSDFNFNLDLKLQLDYQLPPASGLPPCSLLFLEIADAQLVQLPVGFLSTCANLVELTITGNKMNILQELDVATFYSLRNLKQLNLGYNAIRKISPYLGKKGLQHVKGFLLNQLKTWISRHDWSPFSQKDREAFNKLLFRFSNWSDASEPLTYPALVSILEEVKLNIYFSINYSPLQRLNLMNNQLSQVSISLFGFSHLISLYLGFNRLENCLNEPQSITLHAFRKSLKTFRVNNNVIKRIGYNGFKYLKDVSFINIDNNRVYRLNPESFPENNTINELFMRHNLLRHIRLQRKMANLTALDLSYNRLTNLDWRFAQAVPCIAFLMLQGNPIRALAPFSLRSLLFLRVLHMENTSLTEMPAETYATALKSMADRPVIHINSDKGSLITCDCKSVFNAIALEKNKATNFTYPIITWSKNQFCRSPILGKIPISVKRTFGCYFTDNYCPDSCPCCQDLHRCPCRYQCPYGCICSYTSKLTDITVNCKKLNITRIPIITFPAYYLYLQSNKISTISPNSFSQSLSSLVSLHLGYNRLQIVGPHTFRRLSKLIFIDLSQNCIHTIDVQAFAFDVPALIILDLVNNSLSTLRTAPFLTLKNLTRLRLTRNSLTCSCSDLLDFLDFKAAGGASRDLLITMEYTCIDQQSGKNISLGSLPNMCEARAQTKEAKKRLQRWRLHMGLLSGGCMLVILLLLLLLSHHRHHLRMRLDSAIRSALGRSLLRLSPANRSCRLDVAFLVHERQAEQFRAMQRRLQHSSRRALTTAWLADHMPGALRLSAAASLATEAAVCVVLLSEELLDDAVCAESLRMLLTCAIEHRLQLVPVLLGPRVVTHELWPPFDLLLRHWPLLRWGKPFFWERFLTALPPPPPQEGAYEQLRELPRTEEALLAQVCVVADEHQVAGPVRRLFDRWRSAVQLCHLRGHFVYGDTAAVSVPLTLNATLALCQQVIVVVSPELLADPWTERRLVPALTARLTTLAFRGSVVLLETGAAVTHLCRERRFRFYEDLRSLHLTVVLTWSAVEANWRHLENLLFTDVTKDGEALAMDEEEFTRCLCRPTFRLADADVEASRCNVFEQNRARREAMGRPSDEGKSL